MSDSPKIVSKKHLARLERERRQKRYLITGVVIIATLVVATLVYGALDQTVLKNNKAVASVGSQSITVKEFQSRVKLARYQLAQRYQNTLQIAQLLGGDPSQNPYIKNSLDQIKSQMDDKVTLGNQILDNLINEVVVDQEAKGLGITVSDAEIDKAMQEGFSFYQNGTPTPAPSITPKIAFTSTFSPTQLALVTITATPTASATPTSEPTLTATPTIATPQNPTPGASETPFPSPTAYTLEGFKKLVQTNLESMTSIQFTADDLRNIFQKQVIYQKVFDAKTKDVSSIEEQVWARHILVDNEVIAQVVMKRIQDGEDFAKVAKETSKDTGTKEVGGDLGWFGRGKMDSSFEKAAFALKIGEVSQPVKSTFGWHIIQMLGHEDRQLSLSQWDQAKQTAFNTWLIKVKLDKNATKYDIWKDVVPLEPTLPAQ